MVLKAASWCKGRPPEVLRNHLLVCAVGDSIVRAKFSQTHPCILPSKKYVYLCKGQLHMNQSWRVPLLLQGLGWRELTLAGLTDSSLSLSHAQWQDLAGNAFTSNVLLALLVAVLLH